VGDITSSSMVKRQSLLVGIHGATVGFLNRPNASPSHETSPILIPTIRLLGCMKLGVEPTRISIGRDCRCVILVISLVNRPAFRLELLISLDAAAASSISASPTSRTTENMAASRAKHAPTLAIMAVNHHSRRASPVLCPSSMSTVTITITTTTATSTDSPNGGVDAA